MLRATFTKLTPKTRQAFHTSAIVREEWTKASLRRMKKVELSKLAKENNLNFSGTKNDIIIQLLTYQTAKIVGANAPSMQTMKKVVVPEVEDDFEPDNAWINAFEMKVAQRGSRKATDNTNDHFTSTSRPHRYNDQIKASTLLQPAEDKPEPTSSCSPVPVISTSKSTATQHEPATVTTSEELEGMDPQWVEAFELKVGSRGARSQLKDTLSPSTSTILTPVDELEFVTIDKKNNIEDKDIKHESDKIEHKSEIEEENKVNGESKLEQENKVKEEHKLQEKLSLKKEHHVKNYSEEDDKQQHYHNDITQNDTESGNSSSRDKIINTAVGSSMFLWYYEDGLSKIWHFLTSSS